MSKDPNIMIRLEQPTDSDRVYRLHYEVFGNREVESKIAERIRESDGYIPELSLIATENDGNIVGHALFSKAKVVNEDLEYEVIVLGPLAVKPSHQKHGIGGSLIREGLRVSAENGYSHVFLVGHPSYYPKFGFEPARQHGFELKQFEVPDEAFMVNILLTSTGIKGELQYPQAFFV